MLTSAVTTSNTTVSHIASLIMDDPVIRCGKPTHVVTVTEYGMKFVSKVFGTLCFFNGAKLLPIMAYHLHTNGQAERCNNTIIARLHHSRLYVAEHLIDGNTIVQQLTYGDGAQLHFSIKFTHFSLVLSRHLTVPMTFHTLRFCTHFNHNCYNIGQKSD